MSELTFFGDSRSAARLDAVESSRAFYGPSATVQPLLDALDPGTEYVWNKTDGAGVLLDIVSGVTS